MILYFNGTVLQGLSRFLRLYTVFYYRSACLVIFYEPAVLFQKKIFFTRFDAAGIADTGSAGFERSRKAYIGDPLYLKAPSVIPVYTQRDYISVRVKLSCYRYILLHIHLTFHYS